MITGIEFLDPKNLLELNSLTLLKPTIGHIFLLLMPIADWDIQVYWILATILDFSGHIEFSLS